MGNFNNMGTSLAIVPTVDNGLLERQYAAYADECTSAVNIAIARITNAQRSLVRSTGYDLFERVEYRIKSYDSALEKCRRKGCGSPTIEWIAGNIFDIAGIRIVTKFIDEIDKVENLIRKIPGITVSTRKDYVTHPKDNGYSSLHLGTLVEVFDPDTGSKLLPVEIQIRDLTMNLWATIEHLIRYKNPNPSPLVEQEFGPVAEDLRAFAKRAVELRDYAEFMDGATNGVQLSEITARKGPTNPTNLVP